MVDVEPARVDSSGEGPGYAATEIHLSWQIAGPAVEQTFRILSCYFIGSGKALRKNVLGTISFHNIHVAS